MDRYFVLFSRKGEGWKWRGFPSRDEVGPFLEHVDEEGYEFFVIEGKKIEAKSRTENVTVERKRYEL